MIVFQGEKPPGLHEIVARLAQKHFKEKKNFFMVIVGRPGSGKSYTALKFAETIEPDFSPQHQIAYFPEQFQAVMDYVREHKKKVIVFDEAHVTLSSRKWFSATNVALNNIMTTFRQLHRLAVFFVTPYQNFVDKQLRGLFDYYCIVEKVQIDDEIVVYGMLYKIGTNLFDLRDQTPYLQKVRILWNGEVYVVGEMRIDLPSERVINEYENQSMKFKSDVLRKALETIVGKDNLVKKVQEEINKGGENVGELPKRRKRSDGNTDGVNRGSQPEQTG
jgi:energy-coupling factor transporter ATP-binding protein EcfA2